MRLVSYLVGLVVWLGFVLVAGAAEIPLHISKSQAIELAIERSSFALHREIQSSATLIVGSKSSLAPVGVREVDSAAVKKWVTTLAEKSIWKIRVCPLSATGITRFCIISLIDAQTGSSISLP